MPWAILGILLLGGVAVAAVTAAVIATRPRAPTAPVISSFTANVHHVCSGGALGLNWSASGGSATLSATLQPGQTVDGLGPVGWGGTTVHPRVGVTGNVTFTLTVASPGFTSVSQSLTVEVVGTTGTYVPPLPALNTNCRDESGTAWGDDGSGNPITVQYHWNAWVGTNQISDWDPNLVVSVVSLAPSGMPREVFVQKDSVVIRLRQDLVYIPLRGFPIGPVSVSGTWTLFSRVETERGEVCPGGDSTHPTTPGTGAPPMGVIIQVACPS